MKKFFVVVLCLLLLFSLIGCKTLKEKKNGDYDIEPYGAFIYDDLTAVSIFVRINSLPENSFLSSENDFVVKLSIGKNSYTMSPPDKSYIQPFMYMSFQFKLPRFTEKQKLKVEIYVKDRKVASERITVIPSYPQTT